MKLVNDNVEPLASFNVPALKFNVFWVIELWFVTVPDVLIIVVPLAPLTAEITLPPVNSNVPELATVPVIPAVAPAAVSAFAPAVVNFLPVPELIVISLDIKPLFV